MTAPPDELDGHTFGSRPAIPFRDMIKPFLMRACFPRQARIRKIDRDANVVADQLGVLLQSSPDRIVKLSPLNGVERKEVLCLLSRFVPGGRYPVAFHTSIGFAFSRECTTSLKRFFPCQLAAELLEAFSLGTIQRSNVLPIDLQRTSLMHGGLMVKVSDRIGIAQRSLA